MEKWIWREGGGTEPNWSFYLPKTYLNRDFFTLEKNRNSKFPVWLLWRQCASSREMIQEFFYKGLLWWLPARGGFRAYCEVGDVEYMAGTWRHKTCWWQKFDGKGLEYLVLVDSWTLNSKNTIWRHWSEYQLILRKTIGTKIPQQMQWPTADILAARARETKHKYIWIDKNSGKNSNSVGKKLKHQLN